ncbi:3-methyl-2-oxobutanoate hydroxymethyltransferase [Crenothrix sp. D3]|nr:3-methyl-2-oxobutanoate hydroxymethyltransferase [Crenothrix sp. D3]
MNSLYGATVKTLTVQDVTAMKQRGEKITCLTAYDASFSALCDAVGIDMLLVGDSLGMVIQGQKTTLSVTINDMIYHTRCVSQARRRAFIIADLPFMSYPTPLIAAQNAALLMQEGGAQMVKLEGARVEITRFLVEQGIPICGHLGLLPQQINQLGSYKVQGKTTAAADKILAEAQQLEQAGASLLVLECVPAALAKAISHELTIPTIGIGAGVDCDGQVLVLYDMLGISIGKSPRFSKNFMQDASSISDAITAYQLAVKQSQFPTSEHSF